MLPVPTTVRLMLFILGVSAQFLCPYPGYFFFLTANCLFRFLLFSVRFNLVFSPGYIPDLRSMAFLPNTILSPDSFPFLSVPTGHPPVLPGIPRSESLYLPISPWTAIHICHFHSCNLIFLLSLHGSPFQIFSCLLYTGACHAPVLIIKEKLPSKTLRHSTPVQIFFSRLLPFFLCRSSFELSIQVTHYHLVQFFL